MSKKEELLFQSQSLKPSSTIIWNNNNINGNININNNYSNSINSIQPIKRSGSITFKKDGYNNKNVISSPIITPGSSHYKQIKLGGNGNKSKPKTKNYSNNHFGNKTEGNELEMNHAKNYINYLHEHLDTSYNTNNELSNKTEMIINMTKDIESEIKRNNDIYKSLILSYNDKLKANNKYKNEFINFLNQYKKQFKSFSTEITTNKAEFDELSKKNASLKKEIKDTEEIISYLKKTEEILENNGINKYKEEFLNMNTKEKENKEKNEIKMLNDELNKLIEIKNIGDKDLKGLTERNLKLKEKINKLENQLKKNKKNNNDTISINSSNLINDKKIRNKKFILDNNKKYKKNNNSDYYKQLLNTENNKTKDLLNQIYAAIKSKINENNDNEEEEEEEEEEEKPKQKQKQKKIKDNDNDNYGSQNENKKLSTSKNKIGRNKNKSKNLNDINIDNEDNEDLDNDVEIEEEEIKEKEIIIKTTKRQTEEQLTSTIAPKSSKINNKSLPKTKKEKQTLHKNNKIIITKSENENENDIEEISVKEKEREREIETEIERDVDVEREKREKRKKKTKFKDEEKMKEKEKEKEKKKKISKGILKEKSNSKDKSKSSISKEKSLDTSKIKDIDKSFASKGKKAKTKSKDTKKSKDKTKASPKEKLDFSKKEKEYEFSVLSDQSKKSKLFSHITQNSLSMDELSSIMSSGKTQKKLSQSQESIIDILTAPLKGAYLYTITNKGKLLSFNIAQKKFAIIDSNIIDGWTSFVPNYLKNIEGSLLLNTLEGLFIITGANHNNLYFYSQEKNLIAEIISFKSGHKYGGLLLSPSPDNNLFAIGGENENNEVELLSFENDQCKNLPNLMTRRINASYTFINSKLYAIFGEGNNTIEYLNIKKLKNKWTKIDYKMDKNHKGYINNIYGHVSLPVDNDILIVGGKNNKKMMVLDLDEKTLDVTDMKVPFIDVVGEYLFDKEKFFNQTCNEEKKDQDGKNIKQLIGMDTSGNVHLFDYNFNYVVLLIKNHVKEK